MSIGPLGRSTYTFNTGSTVIGHGATHINFRTGSTVLGGPFGGTTLGPGIPAQHIPRHHDHTKYHLPPSQRGPIAGIDTHPGGPRHGSSPPGAPHGPSFGGRGHGIQPTGPGHVAGTNWYTDPFRRFHQGNERLRREQEDRARRLRQQTLTTPVFPPRPPDAGFWSKVFGRRPHPTRPTQPTPALTVPGLVQQVVVNDANVRKIAMGGKDVDITQLLNNVPIDGVSHVVATAKAKDGTKWQWTVKIDVDAPGMPNRTEKDLGTLKDGTKERRLTIHVNSKDAATQTTAAAESAAGRHLFHEAIHANLIMDGDRIAIGVATKSQLFTDFQKDLVTASQVGPERTSLVQAVGAIVASAGPSTPARSQGWTNGAVEFLVTERFAARRTSATFGQVASNAKIADAYVGEVFGRLPGHNTNAGAMLGRNLSGLITNFFNAMDRHP